MSDTRDHPQPDLSNYSENRAKFPVEELEKYLGQWVAFSPDGKRILAHGPDLPTAEHALQLSGIDGSQVVWSRIPGEDEDIWL